MQTADPSIAHGAPTGTPGGLNLDGIEYASGFDLLLFDFQAAGSSGFSGGMPFQAVSIDTDLTLHPVDIDLRQDGKPRTTRAVFVIWDENEFQHTGLYRCITCWDQTLLSLYTVAQNHFLVENLQTDKGKAHIDGDLSPLCSPNCCTPRLTGGCEDFDCQALICQVDAFCCTASWDLICAELAVDNCPEICDGINTDASLLGVAAKHLSFNGGPVSAASGANLIGLGVQSAVIRYDLQSPPPPPAQEPTATLLLEMLGTLLPDDPDDRSGGDATLSPEPAPPRGAVGAPMMADRVSGTEKGSLLIFSKVELRWDVFGNLVQDTIIHLANDWPQGVQVKLYFVNGDEPLPEGVAVGP